MIHPRAGGRAGPLAPELTAAGARRSGTRTYPATGCAACSTGSMTWWISDAPACCWARSSRRRPMATTAPISSGSTRVWGTSAFSTISSRRAPPSAADPARRCVQPRRSRPSTGRTRVLRPLTDGTATADIRRWDTTHRTPFPLMGGVVAAGVGAPGGQVRPSGLVEVAPRSRNQLTTFSWRVLRTMAASRGVLSA